MKKAAVSARLSMRIAFLAVVGGLTFGLSTAIAQSNVGIGTTTPSPSAILDLTSTSMGFLVPRMTTTQRTTNIVSPATGLLVYDLTLNTFYYYNGTVWLPFTSAVSGWLTSGNTGTTAGTNFVGTTDAQDLVFKTNSVEGYRLTSGGLLGIGNAAPTQKLEVHGNIKLDSVTGASSQLQFQNPAGTFNTTFQAGAQAANIAYTLPLTQGAANTVLTNNGSGALSWNNSNTFDWTLVGNSGTTAGTNFLGTIDNVDLVFKTFNTEGMRLSATQNLGIGTNLPTSVLHTVASGAKVANYTGNLLTNTATSSTASITKYGAEILSTGTWNGTTATNVGLHVNATGGTTNYSAIFEGGNVGVNTTSPAAKVDVSGDVATRYSAYTASNGTNNDIAVGATSFARITGPTAAFTITGIAGGVDGKILVLYNSTTQSFTLSNENASSLAANRITSLNSTGDIVINGKGAVKMIYSAADSRWLVMSTSTTVSLTNTGIIIKKKTVNETVTSSSTLQNDNDLFIPINANDSMKIQGYFDMKENTANKTGKVAFTIPSGATMNIVVTTDNNAAVQQDFLKSSGTATAAIDGTPTTGVNEQGILIYGTIVTGSTAGNIQLQWAQGTSGTDQLTFAAGSYLKGIYIR
jgi:hypothetical protein